MPADPPDGDLTDAIRDALRSEEITTSDLRRPVLRGRPTRTRPRTRTLAAIASAAAVVAVIAVVVSVLVSGRNGDQPPPTGNGSALAGVIGYRWDVTRVQDETGEIAVPASLGAVEIGFTRDGYVRGSDGVNALQARYEQTSDGYRVADAGSTLVLPPADPTRQRIIAAVDVMFFTVTTSADTTPPPVSVTAALSGSVLTLRRAGITLTLTRGGTQPDNGTPSATASRTATPTTTATYPPGCYGVPGPGGGPRGPSGVLRSCLVATIDGRLIASGGPPGQPDRGLTGTVTITNGATGKQRSVPVGVDGKYSVTVPYGTYDLDGRSPQYVINGAEGVCRAERSIDLTTQTTAHVDVVCVEK